MPLYAIGPDQLAHNFNSLEIGALPEIRLLAVESGGDEVFQQYRSTAVNFTVECKWLGRVRGMRRRRGGLQKTVISY